jgi:2-oxoglutarate ferredoxin oxidoreductase subunit gamma
VTEPPVAAAEQATPAAPVARAAAARHEVRFSGSGGQGIILAATLLADAAVATGREVVATQNYGPEARGGASKAEVIVSDDEIDFPEVTVPVITVCLSQEAFDAYAGLTVPGGLVVYDDRLVRPSPLPQRRLVGLPFTELAETELGKAIAANIVMLGAVSQLSGLVDFDSLAGALRRRMPARIVELNLRALQLGHDHAARLDAAGEPGPDGSRPPA